VSLVSAFLRRGVKGIMTAPVGRSARVRCAYLRLQVAVLTTTVLQVRSVIVKRVACV